MEFTKKMLALFLAFILIFAGILTGCSGHTEDEQPSETVSEEGGSSQEEISEEAASSEEVSAAVSSKTDSKAAPSSKAASSRTRSEKGGDAAFTSQIIDLSAHFNKDSFSFKSNKSSK